MEAQGQEGQRAPTGSTLLALPTGNESVDTITDAAEAICGEKFAPAKTHLQLRWSL